MWHCVKRHNWNYLRMSILLKRMCSFDVIPLLNHCITTRATYRKNKLWCLVSVCRLKIFEYLRNIKQYIGYFTMNVKYTASVSFSIRIYHMILDKSCIRMFSVYFILSAKNARELWYANLKYTLWAPIDGLLNTCPNNHNSK